MYYLQFDILWYRQDIVYMCPWIACHQSACGNEIKTCMSKHCRTYTGGCHVTR